MYKSPESEAQRRAAAKLTWLYYTNFVRAGARLGPRPKRGSRDQSGTGGLYTKFSQNVLAEEMARPSVLKSEAESGRSAAVSARCRCAATAVTRKQPGLWIISNTRSSVDPFLTYSERPRAARKRGACSSTAVTTATEHDNNATITEILQLRAERAKLLVMRLTRTGDSRMRWPRRPNARWN